MKKQGIFVLFLSVLFFLTACPKPELKVPGFKNVSVDKIAKITLEWERNYEADYYDLHFSDSETGTFSLLKGKIEDTVYEDVSDEVKKGAKRFYKLVAVDVDVTGAELRRSAFSEAVAGESLGFDASLGAVSALSAKVLSFKTEMDPPEESVAARFLGLQIKWDAMEKADFYGVWRSVDGGEYLRILHQNDKEQIPLLLTDPLYSDFTLKSGHSYKYQIRPVAIDKTNPSQLVTGEASSVVSIVMPSLETQVSWNATGSNTVDIFWTPIEPALDASSYRWNRIQGDHIDFIFPPSGSSNPFKLVQSGLDNTKSYTYVLYVLFPLELLVNDTLQPEEPVANYFFDTGKSLSVSFFEQVAHLAATQGTADKVTLQWNNTPDLTVSNFDIYRQKANIEWKRQGDNLSFPEAIYSSVEAIEADQVNLFQNNSFAEQSKLLFLGSVSAVDSGGARLPSITYIDQSQDLQKMHPGSYRYYVVAGRAVISTIGYRTISDKEFLQEVSRQLDRAMSVLYGEKPGTVHSALGGDFSVTYKSNGFASTGHEVNYLFNLFKTPIFTFHTPDPDGINDKSIGRYYTGLGYYLRRFGTLEVTGFYEGSIKYHLPREPKSAKSKGGAYFASHYWALEEKDLDFSTSNDKFLGWWGLTRGASPVQRIRWDNNDSSLYNNESAYNNGAKNLEPKVEPNYQSDYITWE